MNSITSTPHPTDLNLVVLTRTCPFCGKEHSITVNKLEYLVETRQSGTLIKPHSAIVLEYEITT
jgi:hypothetical protein